MKLAAGIHDGISSVDYHADPASTPSLSNSLLTTLLQKTPRHAWLAHPRLNPDFKPEPPASIFDRGTAAHSLLLEGIDAVAIVDAADWKTNAAKEARDKARAAGKIPMLVHQAAEVLAMIRAANAYVETTSLAGIFQNGKAEQTAIARISGVHVRVRPDWLTDDVVLDYKTTGAGGPGEWMRRNIIEHGYDTQSVLYPRVLAACGRRVRFLFLVQENFEPFMCYLVEPAGSMVELAESKISRGLQLWKDCLARDSWPGYPTDVHQAEAPVWAMKEEEAHA